MTATGGDAARGLALLKAGQAAEALPLLKKAASDNPDVSALQVLLGHTQAMLRDHDAAASAYRAALSLDPSPASLWYALGLVERDRGQFEAAGDCQEQVIAREPGHVEAHFELAQIMLLNGDYGRGFTEYEWRLKRTAAPDRPRPQPVWNGEDIQGKNLLVYGEQGMGDVLQMARFLPALTSRGAKVTLAVQLPLVPLLQDQPGTEQVVAIGDEPSGCDFRVALLSLPQRLGTTLDNLPNATYIAASEAPTWPAIRAASGRKIGLVWAGSALHQNDRNRSLPFDALRPLVKLPDTTLFSLQVGEPAADLQGQTSIIDLSPHLTDFADTAAAVAHLDLVITVDTAVAHLAGAMGKPVWILIPRIPDWRWMNAREDSPWYPSARLFRQDERGNWNGPLARIEEALLSPRSQV